MNNIKFYTDVDSDILEEKKIQVGKIGVIFGAKENAPNNITGTLVLLLVGSGIVVQLIQFFSCNNLASEYWKIISPIITLALGYLFGKDQK